MKHTHRFVKKGDVRFDVIIDGKHHNGWDDIMVCKCGEETRFFHDISELDVNYFNQTGVLTTPSHREDR